MCVRAETKKKTVFVNRKIFTSEFLGKLKQNRQIKTAVLVFPRKNTSRNLAEESECYSRSASLIGMC